jgi:hypothetical protein
MVQGLLKVGRAYPCFDLDGTSAAQGNSYGVIEYTR